MSTAMDSKSATAYLINPLNEPEPAAETGPGSHYGSTFAGMPSGSTGSKSQVQAKTRSVQAPVQTPSSTGTSLSSNNPFRDAAGSRNVSGNGVIPPWEAFPEYREGKESAHRRVISNSGSTHRRAVSNSSNRSHRSSSNAPPPYTAGTGSGSPGDSPKETRHRRRTSSLSARYPGDTSHKPLEAIIKDEKKAHRSPHLNKRHLPGADTIDRLDPAIAGRAYHHEGPYDAALLARNTSYNSSPVAALQETNAEALKATPRENVQDAVERHKPLDGVAFVPPGMTDRFGRTYDYEEGADLMHEDNPDGPGMKRWTGQTYDKDDLKGKGEPTYSLDRALRNHTINDNGIEMSDRSSSGHKKHSSRDSRDPVLIAGGEREHQDLEYAATHDNDAGIQRSGSLRAGIKKRIGSLRKKRADS